MLQNVSSIQEDPSLKKWVRLLINWIYPAKFNSLPAFEFVSPAHYFLHLALTNPVTIKQNGYVSSIFDNAREIFDNSS